MTGKKKEMKFRSFKGDFLSRAALIRQTKPNRKTKQIHHPQVYYSIMIYEEIENPSQLWSIFFCKADLLAEV